jgi:hypothetical protein
MKTYSDGFSEWRVLQTYLLEGQQYSAYMTRASARLASDISTLSFKTRVRLQSIDTLVRFVENTFSSSSFVCSIVSKKTRSQQHETKINFRKSSPHRVVFHPDKFRHILILNNLDQCKHSCVVNETNRPSRSCSQRSR